MAIAEVPSVEVMGPFVLEDDDSVKKCLLVSGSKFLIKLPSKGNRNINDCLEIIVIMARIEEVRSVCDQFANLMNDMWKSKKDIGIALLLDIKAVAMIGSSTPSFSQSCTILGKVCIFVVDPGSCDYLKLKRRFRNWDLKAENRSKTLKLQCLSWKASEGGSIMARIEERLDQFVDQFANLMNDMMNPRRHRDRNSQGSEGEESENPRWESRIRVNIPEFDGNTLNPKGFIDWLVAVEEVFEFKEVPENKRVSLIATKLRGRASAWWQQLKLTRKRVGKPRVTSWRKMKKLLRENFIPHNYQRNDIQETDDQLVSRYIGGLRAQIMDSVNMFDPVTLSDAYQRALAFEKQNRRVKSSSSPAITGGSSGSGNVTSRFVPNQTKVGGGNTGPVSKGVGSSGLKCFNCGEPSHRQSECRKAGKRTLFAELEEWEDDGVANDDYEEAPVFDDDQYEEEIMTRDVGVNLMVRRSCLTSQAVGDDWLKHNIF
ncbi:reverse transcriptase domain-containing protein [Tanacetum coccineum]